MFDTGETRRRGDKETRRIRRFTACLLVSLSPCPVPVATTLLALSTLSGVTFAGDMNVVPLLNGERADSLNLWGGPSNAGNIASFTKQSSVFLAGDYAGGGTPNS